MPTYLKDIQLESRPIASRWMLSEVASSSFITDDIGGTIASVTGAATLGVPSIIEGDASTCAIGGYASGALAGFQATIVAFAVGAGVTIEGATAADPNGQPFYLLNAPGQASLTITSTGVQFSVWTAAQHTISAPAGINGYPQLVHGVYDALGGMQSIYIDGIQVVSSSLTGAVAAATTATTQLLVATGASNCVAIGQDIALYSAALSQNQILRHYQAFMQQWRDPVHVRTYPRISAAA